MECIEVRLCMGSSCFSRGNKIALKNIQDYISHNNLESKVVIKGGLCEGVCQEGPNLFVDGKHYTEVKPESVIDILKYHLGS